ncbi:hypothetical protein AMTR_s00045p00208800 [Amborella trichopoda]|uniref:Uncharacterized protein n=1 Tax=Amborella trichopoda TaxID=13333 RepID=W1P5I5_AMBTC|nr:hypothetical protein AMTR_s00045p00208800 [Amborella trichopoda]
MGKNVPPRGKEMHLRTGGHLNLKHLPQAVPARGGGGPLREGLRWASSGGSSLGSRWTFSDYRKAEEDGDDVHMVDTVILQGSWFCMVESMVTAMVPGRGGRSIPQNGNTVGI